MDVRPIHSEADYKWALAEISAYFDRQPQAGSPESARFDVLTTLIEAYENKTVEMPDADPVDVLKFAIESMGRSRDDLADLVGSPLKATQILDRRKRLTLLQIGKISRAWRIPADLLITPYDLDSRAA